MSSLFGTSLEKHRQTHLPYVAGSFDADCRHCTNIGIARAHEASEHARNLRHHAAHETQGFLTDPNCAICKGRASDFRSRARSDAENALRRDDEG